MLRLLFAYLAASAVGCTRKHQPVDAVPELPYPACDGADAGPAVSLGFGRLRGAPDSMAKSEAIEAFSLEARGCLVVATVHQEWKRGVTDVEVVFDTKLAPLRAWKRTAAPSSSRPDGNSETRRYDFRTPEVTLKRAASGDIPKYEILRGARPEAVIGPGRGLLTAWIKRARLSVGEKVREPVLDFRESYEVIRDVTLKREGDRDDPALKRRVRVYTIYGREAVFTDEYDVVVGDLAGLRPSDTITTPEPAPAQSFGAVDPVRTP